MAKQETVNTRVIIQSIYQRTMQREGLGVPPNTPELSIVLVASQVLSDAAGNDIGATQHISVYKPSDMAENPRQSIGKVIALMHSELGTTDADLSLQ